MLRDAESGVVRDPLVLGRDAQVGSNILGEAPAESCVHRQILRGEELGLCKAANKSRK